jgi:hypothetical protein
MSTRAARHHAAVHEAGHSLAAIVHGVPVAMAGIYELEVAQGCEQGMTWIDDELSPLMSLYERIAFLLGGGVANARDGAPDRGDSLDWQLAVRAVQRRHPQRSEAQARDLIARCVPVVDALIADQWPWLCRVAAALEQRSALDGDEIEALRDE